MSNQDQSAVGFMTKRKLSARSHSPTHLSPVTGWSRRRFLRRVGLATGLAAAPALIPGSALGLNGTVRPSERIVMGGLGIGGRGSGVLNWMLPEKDVQFVAICDAKRSQREAVKRIIDNKYGTKDCAMYRDIREFLATRTDIDALLIATGDRWHALASVLAMRAGKDVYSEKPSSMSIAEGQAVVATARRYGRVYQTGTQRLSGPAGQGQYRAGAHRSLGCSRDEIRLASS